MDLFENIANIFEKNKLPPINGKSNLLFMINRYLSMNPISFLESTEANYYNGKIPNSYVERLLFYSVQKETPAPFIKYIKNKKDKSGKIDKKVLSEICNKYCCNENHGKEIIEILKAEGKNVKKMLGFKGK